jgi:ATP phosphoribosyltransferase regulatory subunit
MTLPPGLLPEGLRDRLPPQAEAASGLTRTLADSFAAHGYDRVQPPLIEYEETLASRLGPYARRELIRFTDPASQATLALRSDITGQVGRIAVTRLAAAPRPLRLCYAGAVLRVSGDRVRAEREAVQAGAELIGSDSIAAATEVLSVAVEALARAGVTDIAVDLVLPDLIETLAGLVLPPERIAELKGLLDMKDAGGLAAAGLGDWLPLIAATGPVETALPRLRAFDHAGLLASRLDGVAALAGAVAPYARVTLDPTERHGFEYQTWIGFSIFGAGMTAEAGRGGAYQVTHPDGRQEPAIGFSLYVDTLVDAGLGGSAKRRIWLPAGTDPAIGARLRGEGWATVAGFAAADPVDPRCTHVWNGECPTSR